jgi:predicted nucleic acid-binding protein
MEALLDTSFLVGPDPPEVAHPPADAGISVLTLAELTLGVLLAKTLKDRTARLAVLSEIEQRFDPVPVDGAVARAYAEIVAAARQRGARPRPFDALIAATALVHRVPVYTRDRDFLRFPEIRVELVS